MHSNNMALIIILITIKNNLHYMISNFGELFTVMCIHIGLMNYSTDSGIDSIQANLRL